MYFSSTHFFTKLVFRNIDFCSHCELKYVVAVLKWLTTFKWVPLFFLVSPVLKSFTFLVASFSFLSHKNWYWEHLIAVYILGWIYSVNCFCLLVIGGISVLLSSYSVFSVIPLTSLEGQLITKIKVEVGGKGET